MTTVEAVAESLESLWAGLPSSNVFKQKKLTGLRENGEEPLADGTSSVCHTSLMETTQYAELRTFLDASSLDFNTVMLATYHLVLQWYLDDVESLIGCCLLAPGAFDGAPGVRPAILRASYVYAEDDDSVEGLLRDVERQLQSERALEVTPTGPSSWDTRRAPVFFYAGVDGVSGPSASADLDAMQFPEGRVVVVAGAGPERAEVVVSMPLAVSHAVGIGEFQRRYGAVLHSLLTGGSSRVGELRAQLGDASKVPYRQLDEMQRRVIALWARVLSIPEDDLSESSSYFDVGGTSLNAFKLVNLVRIEFQRDLSIRDIIENSTIEEFARLLLKD